MDHKKLSRRFPQRADQTVSDEQRKNSRGTMARLTWTWQYSATDGKDLSPMGDCGRTPGGTRLAMSGSRSSKAAAMARGSIHCFQPARAFQAMWTPSPAAASSFPWRTAATPICFTAATPICFTEPIHPHPAPTSSTLFRPTQMVLCLPTPSRSSASKHG